MKLPKPKIKGVLKEKSIRKEDLQVETRAIPMFVVFFLLVIIGTGAFYLWRSIRPQKEPEERLTIVTTIFPVTDMLSNIVAEGGEYEVVQLIPNGTDPAVFSIDQQAQDAIAGAYFVIKIGAGFDDWVDEYVTEGTGVLNLSKVVELQKKREFDLVLSQGQILQEMCQMNGGIWVEEHFECENIDSVICEEKGGEYTDCGSSCRHSDNEVCIQVCVPLCTFQKATSYEIPGDELTDENVDPYYWLSVNNAKKMVEAMHFLVAQLKPGYQNQYSENVKNYRQSLDETKTYIQEEVDKMFNRRILTYSNTYQYFDNEYDFDVAYVYRPAEVVDQGYTDALKLQLEIDNISYVYVETYEEDSALEEFATALGLDRRILDPFGGNQYTDSYITMMRYNIDSLRGTVLYE